jgi:hypothetical protein
MLALKIIFIVLSSLLLFVTMISHIISIYHFKVFKKTYQALISGDYVFTAHDEINNHYYFTKDGIDLSASWCTGKLIAFYPDDGAIKLLGHGNYAHIGLLNYFNPYALYWIKKLMRWFEENKNNFQ